MTLPISSAWTRSSTEARRRWDAWNRLGCPDPGAEVKPGDLRRVGLYGGAQGIWVDKQKTVSDSFSDGIAVSVLHTDSAYPDEISEGGTRYHYPKTDRPDSRDAGEVGAVKNCQKSSLPLLFITRPTPGSASRLCRWAWVEDSNDTVQEFYLSFDARPTLSGREQAFDPTEASKSRRALAKVRSGQSRFRFLVEKRYGAECAVCGIGIRAMLQAAHIVAKEFNGTDDPRNGLMLCANHHAAFDAMLFSVEPDSLELVPCAGESVSSLVLLRGTLQHLRLKPAIEALRIRYAAHPA